MTPIRFINAVPLAFVAFTTAPSFADVTVQDPYARVASPMAKAGAAFMVLENPGGTDVRLIAVQSEAAKRIELHTHEETDGVMKMREIEGGIVVPAGGAHALERGGDHVMFMGLTKRWAQGDLIPVTLVFDNDTTVTLDIPVDLTRKPMAHGN